MPTTPIVLYRAEYSTNAERVALACAYKGIEVESRWIEYSDRSEVERVSGQGLVPVIVDGDRVVTDSSAILKYLESIEPTPALYPADRARAAEIDIFIDWLNRVWKVAPNAIEAELAKVEPDEGRIAALADEMSAALRMFEELLAGRDYLFGEQLTAADLIAFPFLKYAARRDPADDEAFHVVLDEYQQLGRGLERLGDWIDLIDALPRA